MKQAAVRRFEKRLLRDIESPDWEIRLQAVERVESASPPIQQKVLTIALGDVSELVRIASLEAIDALRKDGFRPALFAALSDRHALVRAHCAITLVRFCSDDDLPVLERHLSASRSMFRITLLWALAALGQPHRVEALITAIRTARNYHDACMGARLAGTLELDVDTKTKMIKALRAVQARFETAAVDDAVEAALLRLLANTVPKARSASARKKK